MRFEKLKDSSLLKPGELLVVLKNTAFFQLQQSAESGRLQFYRNRQEPVPWINRVKHGRLFRRPKTTNERRAHFSNKATEEILQSYGVALKLRQKRKSHMLPNAYDDLSLRYQRSWKEHRGTQRKKISRASSVLSLNYVTIISAAASAFLARWIFSRIFRPDARQTYFFGFWLRSAR
jgi:hypothetical protein